MTTTSHHMVPRSDIKEALDTSFYNVTPTHSTWEAECKTLRAEERERAAVWCDVLQHEFSGMFQGSARAALQRAAEAIRSGELP